MLRLIIKRGRAPFSTESKGLPSSLGGIQKHKDFLVHSQIVPVESVSERHRTRGGINAPTRPNESLPRSSVDKHGLGREWPRLGPIQTESLILGFGSFGPKRIEGLCRHSAVASVEGLSNDPTHLRAARCS
jgi:hypothetical protein